MRSHRTVRVLVSEDLAANPAFCPGLRKGPILRLRARARKHGVVIDDVDIIPTSDPWSEHRESFTARRSHTPQRDDVCRNWEVALRHWLPSAIVLATVNQPINSESDGHAAESGPLAIMTLVIATGAPHVMNPTRRPEGTPAEDWRLPDHEEIEALLVQRTAGMSEEDREAFVGRITWEWQLAAMSEKEAEIAEILRQADEDMSDEEWEAYSEGLNG